MFATNINSEPRITITAIMISLESSVEWWSTRADKLGIAAAILGIFTAIVVLAGWYFSWKTGKLKDKLLSEQIKNAPLKAPVTTATASVKIGVSAEVARLFSDKKSSDNSVSNLEFGKSANFEINNDVFGTGTWTLFLRSDSAEQWGNESGSEFFLEFHPLSFAPVNVPENVGELLDAINVVSLAPWFFPPNSEILGGTITLTLNGTTRKTLTIPKTRTSRFGGILLLFSQDSKPTVLTPKVVELTSPNP
jgi:hypothetical protein